VTKIEWTHRPGTTGITWNPVTGCTPISEGCAHCYARRMAHRLQGRFGYPEAPHEFDVTLHPDKLNAPLRWRKPRTAFVVSMGDLFHEDVPFDWILTIWRAMFEAPRHTFLVLTKRAERMERFLNEWLPPAWQLAFLEPYPGPLPNVWGLITAENQDRLNERVPYLLRCPFVVRGVSIEPMLGAIDISAFYPPYDWGRFPDQGDGVTYPFDGLDWVIAGGESGPGARPMHPDWARGIRDQCQAAGVPFFFKQWGANPNPWCNEAAAAGWDYTQSNGGHLLDGREWRQWPGDNGDDNAN